MSEPREQLRGALDRLATNDDVEAAHASVVARARSIRRRRRALATTALVTITVAVGVIATTHRGRDRVTITTPDTVSTPRSRLRIVAVVHGRGLVVLDSTTGAITTTLDNLHDAIGAVSASPDGRDVYYVAGAAGYDPTCGHARILRHSLGDPPGVADTIGPGIFPAVDPTGMRLAFLACDGPSGYADTLVIRDLLSGAERRIPVDAGESSWWATAPRWSPDGRRLAMRVIQGPTGGSPLRILDVEHDTSLATARVVGFSDSGDVFGYLGPGGELLGAVDAGAQRADVVAMTLGPTDAVPRQALFTTRDFPISASADATGNNVLAVTSTANRNGLYVWSAGDTAARQLQLPGQAWFADWLPNPPTSTTVPGSADDGLRVVFTHTSPDGATVTGRSGNVSIAEAHGCEGTAPVRVSAGPNCVPGTAPGLRFDFSAAGAPVYRLTVLDADFPVDAANRLRPVGIASLIRLVRADRSTIPDDGTRRVEIAAFHSSGVANVRVSLAGGRSDAMAPVDGWSAFAARITNGGEPFGLTVDGLDGNGLVVATSLPYRCC